MGWTEVSDDFKMCCRSLEEVLGAEVPTISDDGARACGVPTLDANLKF